MLLCLSSPIGHFLTSFFFFSGPPVEHVREVAQALRAIGDELDKDESLQQYCQAYCTYFYDLSMICFP